MVASRYKAVTYARYGRGAMPTFIDESGGTGHIDQKPYFRLAAVYVPTAAAVAGFQSDAARIRADHNLGAGYEFKFANTPKLPAVRRAFFAAARRVGFRFVVCCIDKNAPRWRTAPKTDFHYLTATYSAATLRPVYQAAEQAVGRRVAEPVVVDDNGDGKYLAAVRAAFRGMRSAFQGVPLTGPPKFGNSATDDLLQLADMTCGAVGARIDGDNEWYDLISGAGLGWEGGVARM